MNIEYRQTSRWLYCAFGTSLLLASCGGSSGGGNSLTPDDGENINPNNARNVAVDGLELIDIVVFAGNTLPRRLAALPRGMQDCSTQGSVNAGLDNDLLTVEFSSCDLIAGETLVLDGTLSMELQTGAFDSGEFVSAVNYDSFSAVRDARSVQLDGQLVVDVSAIAVNATSQDLTVQDDDGMSQFSQIDYVISMGVTETSSIDYTADVARFAATISGVSPNFSGGTASCPGTGELTLTGQDGSSVVVVAAGGESLMTTYEGEMDTINCAEIRSLLGSNMGLPGTPDDLSPPPPPGN